MSTSLQRIERGGLASADSDWDTICQQAGVLVKTGFLPQSIKTPEQAMAIILTGRELGIGTMAALNSINVIQGKPTVSPQLMLALMNRTGQVEDIRIETGAEGASVTIKRKARSAYTAKFGPTEARAMGLEGKDNYKKQPATMYKWRAIADAARVTFPDVILGLYTPDEMGAVVNEDGDFIEAEAARPLRAVPSTTAPAAIEAVPLIAPHTASAIEKLWPKYGQAAFKLSAPSSLAQFLKSKKGVDSVNDLTADSGMNLLGILQGAANSAVEVATDDDPLAIAKARLLKTGVTEEQYQAELKDSGFADPENLTADEADTWLTTVEMWTAANEKKAATKAA